MNYNDAPNRNEISARQLKQFQGLITRLFQCCQERMHYQSEKFQLPDAEFRCLTLFNEERYLTPKGIAQKMNVVKSRVTRIIEGLIRKKLIQRIKDPEDSRVTLLSLTPEGQRKIDAINAFLETIYSEILLQVSQEQRTAMLTNLELLKGSMESVKELMV